MPEELPVQQHCKVCVQPLISADELIAEGEAGHQPPLLEPEYGTEAAGEVDALYTCKRQQTLSETLAAADPPAGSNTWPSIRNPESTAAGGDMVGTILHAAVGC